MLRAHHCLITAAFFALSSASLLHAERWKLQFFHDEDQSNLSISDLAFPSANTGIACGILFKKQGEKAQGVVVVTRDGGNTWKRVEVSDHPVSLFFVDESVGFMATNKGIWKTQERGLTWKKLKGVNGIQRLYFLDANRGFAVGAEKQMIATEDGGLTWTPVPDAKKPTSAPAITGYQWITFDGDKRGVVLGSAVPARRRTTLVPDWADPEAASQEREWPTLSISLETRDSGKTWELQTAPVFGRIARIMFWPKGIFSMSLVRYEKTFTVPSELYLIDRRNGKSTSVFKEKGTAITDFAFTSSSTGLAAAIELPGTMANLPLPGKLKILKSDDFKNWSTIPVDYRASGTRATLAVVDAKNAWVALDSGMILHLEPF